MADHVATQIRDAAVTALTGLTTTGARVFADREYPLQTSNLPGLCIYTRNETEEPITFKGATRRLQRTLELLVVAYAKTIGDLDKTLDTIRKEVETALAADPPLGGLAKELWPQACEKDVDAEGDKPVGVATMVFHVEYHTAQNAPDTALA